MKVVDCFKTMTATVGGVMLAGSAFAQDALPTLESVGKPHDRGIGFQEPVTEVARDILWMDSFLLTIITVITIFVTDDCPDPDPAGDCAAVADPAVQAAGNSRGRHHHQGNR
jgi:hypothetical protein